MAAEPRISVDADTFEAYFDRRPFYVEARISDDPAFSLDHLVEVSKRLPPECVEYNVGNVPIHLRPELTPRSGLSASETIRRIEECGSWLVLKEVERVPAFAELMNDLLDVVEPHARRLVGRTFRRHAFVFVSSPNAVTPFHMDPEHNFLLQVRGQKTVHMWDPEDRRVISEADLERFHAHFTHRNLPYREDFETTAYRLKLLPDQGLHFPVTAPHWVQNGPEVSISLSVTFRSEASARRERLHRMNARLRALGTTPTPVGKNVLADSAKFHLATQLHNFRRLFGASADPSSVAVGAGQQPEVTPPAFSEHRETRAARRMSPGGGAG